MPEGVQPVQGARDADEGDDKYDQQRGLAAEAGFVLAVQ